MSYGAAQKSFVVRVGALVLVSALVLTASFVGLFAFASGQVAGIGQRVPYYLIVMAVAFVATILLLENHRDDGRVILLTTVIVSTVTFGVVVCATEGIIFAQRYPNKVFSSQIVLYLLAASLVGTGLGFWGLRHWREFTRLTRQQGGI